MIQATLNYKDYVLVMNKPTGLWTRPTSNDTPIQEQKIQIIANGSKDSFVDRNGNGLIDIRDQQGPISVIMMYQEMNKEGTGVGNIEVNAFQRLSQVVIQKSIREGFGLVVSETLWKGTPVVAGRTGGIPLQLENSISGFLCESAEDYARRISYLLRNEEDAKAMGERGIERIRERFLTPRLVGDKLKFLCSL